MIGGTGQAGAYGAKVSWLRARKATTFTKCGLCEYLIYCIQTTVNEPRLRYMGRLALHHEFQQAQRKAFQNIVELSMRDPEHCVCFSIDKMDQAKSTIPQSQTLKDTTMFKTGKRFVTGLVGVLMPALTQRPYVFSTLEDMPHGASFQASLLLEVVVMIMRSMGKLPSRIVIGADNTYKETKNTIVLFFLTWLLANTRGTGVQSIEVLYLMTGHTHGPVDAFFSYLMRSLYGQSYATIEKMMGIAQSKMKFPPYWAHARDVFEWKDARPGWCRIDAQHVRGIGYPHGFRLQVDRTGACTIETKRWLTDPAWSAPQVLLDPEGLQRLQGWNPPQVVPNFDRGAANDRHPERDGILSWLGRLENLMAVNSVDNFTLADIEHLRKARPP